jgi:hypothetical protein
VVINPRILIAAAIGIGLLAGLDAMVDRRGREYLSERTMWLERELAAEQRRAEQYRRHAFTVTVGVRLATLAFAGDLQRESLSATERYPGSSLLPGHAIAAWHLFREQPLLARLQMATTKLAVDQRARLDAEIREDLRRRHDNLLDTAVGRWGAAMNDVDDVARELKAIQAGIAVEQFHIKTGTYPDTEDALPLHLREHGLKYERSNDDGYTITKLAGPRPGVVVVEHPPTR